MYCYCLCIGEREVLLEEKTSIAAPNGYKLNIDKNEAVGTFLRLDVPERNGKGL